MMVLVVLEFFFKTTISDHSIKEIKEKNQGDLFSNVSYGKS